MACINVFIHKFGTSGGNYFSWFLFITFGMFVDWNLIDCFLLVIYIFLLQFDCSVVFTNRSWTEWWKPMFNYASNLAWYHWINEHKKPYILIPRLENLDIPLLLYLKCFSNVLCSFCCIRIFIVVMVEMVVPIRVRKLLVIYYILSKM